MDVDDAIREASERLRRGDPHGALGRVRAAREGGAEGPWVDLLEAGATLETGRTQDARRLVAPVSASPDPAVRAHAVWCWGRILAAEGDHERARAEVARALLVDGGLRGDEVVRAEIDLAELDGKLGDEAAADRMLELVRAYADGADPVDAVRVLVRVADARLARRSPAEAERWLAAAEERLGPGGPPALAVAVWERRAEVALRLREPARALLLARRAMAVAAPDDGPTRARLWALVARAHTLHGDLEGAAAACRRGAEIAERAGPGGGVELRLDEIAALAALGRMGEARDRLAALAPVTRHGPADAVHAALSLVVDDGGADTGSVALPEPHRPAPGLPAGSWADRVRRIHRWVDEPAGRTERLLQALDRAAERASDRARAGGSPRDLSRTVRLRGSALRLASDLSDGAEAVRQGRLLQGLGSLGAPIPAGPFDLTRKIGWGAVGDVWRGRHHDHRVAVAVKVLARRHDSPRMAHLFLTEVRAMAVLDHPNIARVLGTGTLGPDAEAVSHGELRGGNPWFAMELAENGTLESVRGRLPWSGVRAVLTSLLDALSHAHARGVIHLDLKCSNALVRRDEGRPVVVLSDFGLAKLVQSDVARGAVVGTPTTMAPEQFRGEARDYGPWTDLYALGAVAIELVTGRPPYDVGDAFEALRDAHLAGGWGGLPAGLRVPPGLDDWLRTLLAVDPAHRFQRAADASAALGRLPDIEEGPPALPAVEGFRPRAFTLSRHSAEEDSLPLPPGPVGAERPGAPHRPPVPADWRPVVDRLPTRDFVDVAPTLFGLARVPLVGREPERDRLWGLLREVAAGQGPRFVAVCGPAGIGRSALARWLGERAHELGAALVLDATGGVDGLPGLRALVERHLHLTGLTVDAAADRVRRALPALPGWVADDLAALVVEHGLAQPLADRVGSVAAMIGLLATGRPVVLRMARREGDDPAEHVLRRLLDDGGTPVCCLVECEDPEDDEVEVRLGPLDAAASEALLDALLPLAVPARRAVARAASGHPDLLVALVGDLLARDALQRGAQAWELRAGEVVELPGAVLAAWTGPVTTALLAASAPVRTALAAAALLGDTLDATRGEAAAEAAGTELRAVALAFRGLFSIEPRPGFVHPAVRAIVLDGVVDLLAAEAAVAAIERAPGGCEPLHATLLVRAGRMYEAPPQLLLGAQRCLDDGDPEQALALLDRRAEILRGLGRDPSGEEQVPDALLRARVALEKGQPDAATLLAIACALAERHEAWGALGEARLGKARSTEAAGDPAGARQELRLAADAFAAAGDVVGTARAVRSAGELALRWGDRASARSLLERALRRLGADDAASRAERAEVHGALASVARADDALDEAERWLSAALGAGDAPPSTRAAVLAVAAAVARDRDDPAAAERHARAALALVPWHDVARVRDLQVSRALTAVVAGRPADARRLLDGLPSTAQAVACQLVLAARAEAHTWAAALAAASELVPAADRDVARQLDLAGQRAAADQRADRALAAFSLAVAAWQALGHAGRAADVERRRATVDRARP